MEAMELNARVRRESGKGPSRRLRVQGWTPAVFYGAGAEATPLSVNTAELIKLLRERKESVFIKLKIEDGKSSVEKLAMIKELQTSPVSRSLYHADFYEIRMDHKLILELPIHLTGVPAGLADGGELHHLKRELKIAGLPSAIPEYVELDVSGLNIGDSVKVSDIHLPEGIEILDAGDIAVAAVSAKTVLEAAPAVEEGAGEEEKKEPEVITAKGKEEES
ncbi:MAG: 50S ribosomal protein L25 [Syntrophales bacterium]